MTPVWPATIALAASLSLGVSAMASKSELPFQKPIPAVEERLKGPAAHYANLSPAQCKSELQKSPWASSFQVQGSQNGIAAPVRIVGPIDGVSFRVPPQKVSYGLLDCRQALLWIELAPMLRRHGVQSIRIDNFYRNRAKVRPGRKSQHAYALAADVVSITFGPVPEEAAAQRRLGDKAVPDSLMGYGEADVERDFLGELGKPVCGADARIIDLPDSDVAQVARAVRMRNLVCEWARDGAFHHILTPNYNAAHKNHLHLDIQRDNKWYSIQ